MRFMNDTQSLMMNSKRLVLCYISAQVFLLEWKKFYNRIYGA